MEYCRFLRNLDFYLFFINSKVFFYGMYHIIPQHFHHLWRAVEISRSFMRSLAYPAERFFSLKKAFTQIPPYKYRLLFEKTTYFS